MATGAHQYKAAVLGLILTVVFIYLNKKLNARKYYPNNISISVSSIGNNDVGAIIELITKNSVFVNFHNLSTSNDKNGKNTSIRLSFTPRDFDQINSITKEINSTFPEAEINIIDNNIF